MAFVSSPCGPQTPCSCDCCGANERDDVRRTQTHNKMSESAMAQTAMSGATESLTGQECIFFDTLNFMQLRVPQLDGRSCIAGHTAWSLLTPTGASKLQGGVLTFDHLNSRQNFTNTEVLLQNLE